MFNWFYVVYIFRPIIFWRLTLSCFYMPVPKVRSHNLQFTMSIHIENSKRENAFLRFNYFIFFIGTLMLIGKNIFAILFCSLNNFRVFTHYHFF